MFKHKTPGGHSPFKPQQRVTKFPKAEKEGQRLSQEQKVAPYWMKKILGYLGLDNRRNRQSQIFSKKNPHGDLELGFILNYAVSSEETYSLLYLLRGNNTECDLSSYQHRNAAYSCNYCASLTDFPALTYLKILLIQTAFQAWQSLPYLAHKETKHG